MNQKLKNYWTQNLSDPVKRCSYISRILCLILILSFGLFILGIAATYFLLEYINPIPGWIETVLSSFLLIIVYVLAYSAKIYIVVIPFIWLIQCWYSIKDKEIKPFLLANLFLWLLVALLALYAYDSNQREAECMKWCVNEDQSNYNDCLFNTCDFPI